MTNNEIKALPLDYFVGKKRTFPSKDCDKFESITYTWERFDSENIVKAMKSIVERLEQ